jgi:hypothetical protein
MTPIRRKERAGLGGKAGVVALSLLLGGLLLVMAVPWLVAECLMLPGNHILTAIENRQEVSAEDLRRLILSRERALAWTQSSATRVELASAQILLAEREVGGGARYHAMMQQAIATLRDGLSRGPANPFAWTRLAYAGLAEAEPARRVVPVLAMAIETAPVQPGLTFARLELCLLEWPYFAQSRPVLFVEQVRVAWHEDPRRLVRLAQSTGRIDAVREAIADGDRVEFDRVVADLS